FKNKYPPLQQNNFKIYSCLFCNCISNCSILSFKSATSALVATFIFVFSSLNFSLILSSNSVFAYCSFSTVSFEYSHDSFFVSSPFSYESLTTYSACSLLSTARTKPNDKPFLIVFFTKILSSFIIYQ